jgi:ribosomal protein L7Ae-like RNA K-turn-binding protein
MNERMVGLLGMALRAGKLTAGQEPVLKLIRRGRAKLILLSEDASENTKKVFHDKGQYYNVPVLEKGSMDQMGRALGKGPRAVVAISDAGFARSMVQNIEEGKGTGPM